MNMLLDNEGLDQATDVLVVGDSTGGVATMQMIDDLHAQVPPFPIELRPRHVPQYRAAPWSNCVAPGPALSKLLQLQYKNSEKVGNTYIKLVMELAASLVSFLDHPPLPLRMSMWTGMLLFGWEDHFYQGDIFSMLGMIAGLEAHQKHACSADMLRGGPSCIESQICHDLLCCFKGTGTSYSI